MPDHNYFSNLIWQIADLLRGPYRPPQYERVMLPMTVLRRFDCVLAPTKAKVLAEYAKRSFPASVATHKPDNDPIGNLAGIVKLGFSPFALAVTRSLPPKSVRELVDYARTRPGQLAYPVPGVGSLRHLMTELFAQQAGIRMLHVPYKSTGLGMPDLLKGETHLILGGLSPLLPFIQQGRLRGLAVTTAKRWYAVPDMPTLAETVPGFVVESWFGLVAPRRTPAAIVAQLNAAANQMVAEGETKKALDALGIAPAGGTSDDFGKLIRGDYARALSVVRDARIRAE